jgi:hypothetical protein
VPRFVEQELRAFLSCAILAHGILAPCASWRYRVVPDGDAALADAPGERAAGPHDPTEPPASADLRDEPTALGESAVLSFGAAVDSNAQRAKGRLRTRSVADRPYSAGVGLNGGTGHVAAVEVDDPRVDRRPRGERRS